MNKCVFCNIADGRLYPVNTTCLSHVELMRYCVKKICGEELYELIYGE